MQIIANMGIPMIAVEFSFIVFLFIPVIIFEALVARKVLSLSLGKALYGSFLGNLVSTLFGIPIAWFLQFILEFGIGAFLSVVPQFSDLFSFKTPIGKILSILFGSAWLPPSENHLYWMIPAALMTLLLPAYWISAKMEGAVLKSLWKDLDPDIVSRTAWKMNTLSYGYLFLCTCSWFGYAIITHS